MTQHSIRYAVTLILLVLVHTPSYAALDVQNEMLARWQLNNADLLIDEGKYFEAIEFINSAYALTEYPQTQSDTLLKKALVLSMFLDEEQAAIDTYKKIQQQFPQKAELCIYRQVLLHITIGQFERAKQLIKEYRATYPDGAYLFQLDAQTQFIEESIALASPAKVSEMPAVQPETDTPQKNIAPRISSKDTATPTAHAVQSTALQQAKPTLDSTQDKQQALTGQPVSQAKQPSFAVQQPVTQQRQKQPNITAQHSPALQREAQQAPPSSAPPANMHVTSPYLQTTPPQNASKQKAKRPSIASKNSDMPASATSIQSPMSSQTLSQRPDHTAATNAKTPVQQKQSTPAQHVQYSTAQPSLRVALAKRTERLTLSATGNGVLRVQDKPYRSSVTVTATGGKLSVNGKTISSQLTVTCSTPIQTAIGGRKKTVRGSISIHRKEHGFLVLNQIKIEDYLLSVVPAESYASWPLESLKAQAVAARTYAYYQKLHRKNLEYDVRADTFDQMYSGVNKEHPRTTKAVRATRGKIVTSGNRPILAQYTANSGGHCADAGAIFNTAKPYLVAHPDPVSLKGKLGSWKRTFNRLDVAHKLSKIGISGSGLIEITPHTVGPSGRVTSVNIRYTNKIQTLTTRTTLASSRVLNLPDILFTVRNTGDTIVFSGHGHGHGVGLSQWGNAELGKKKSAEQILAFYYPTTVLRQEWR
ncbi:MAG: SpoIID/LytB domain-containing protein [Desulfovibrionales bacterium]|nr:SpoIID/LytB domain-containing protein [Desulfovibrionales bacterium]